MRAEWATFLILAACASTPGRGPRVEVSAAREGGALRVRFRRTEPGTAGHPARLEADGGRLEEVTHSPDLLTVSVLWRDPEGELRCAFPYGGAGFFRSDGEADERTFDYVFLEANGVKVTGTVQRGCPMLPSLALRVALDAVCLPARLTLAGGGVRQLEKPVVTVDFSLPRDARGVLLGGDHELVLETARGDRHVILVGVEPDGTPAAVTGYFAGLR